MEDMTRNRYSVTTAQGETLTVTRHDAWIFTVEIADKTSAKLSLRMSGNQLQNISTWLRLYATEPVRG